MALGSEQQLYQSQQLAQKMLYQQYQQQQQQLSQQPRAIAPAPLPRLQAAPYYKPTKTYFGTTLDSNNPSVVRRNARERNRVKQVNSGFTNLRQHIPVAIIADLSNGRRGIGPGANKKLSKVDTLRMAVEYIRRLQRVIEEVDSSDTSSVSSYNTCGGSSTSGSPPPAPLSVNGQYQYYKPHYYTTLSYAGCFQTSQQQQQQKQQQQLQNSTLISPANSQGSSNYSTDSTMLSSPNNHSDISPLKYEQSYDDYGGGTSTDDEELLDYISLWQEDL